MRRLNRILQPAKPDMLDQGPRFRPRAQGSACCPATASSATTALQSRLGERRSCPPSPRRSPRWRNLPSRFLRLPRHSSKRRSGEALSRVLRHDVQRNPMRRVLQQRRRPAGTSGGRYRLHSLTWRRKRWFGGMYRVEVPDLCVALSPSNPPASC